MKTKFLKLTIMPFIAIISVISFIGCATVYNKVPVYFYNTNSTTVISENGKNLNLGEVVYTSSGDATQTTTYFRKGILVPRSKEDRHLVIEQDGKKVELTLESKFATGSLIADIWLGFGVGVIVDLVAGPLRTYKTQHYDVNAIMNNDNKSK